MNYIRRLTARVSSGRFAVLSSARERRRRRRCCRLLFSRVDVLVLESSFVRGGSEQGASITETTWGGRAAFDGCCVEALNNDG